MDRKNALAAAAGAVVLTVAGAVSAIAITTPEAAEQPQVVTEYVYPDGTPADGSQPIVVVIDETNATTAARADGVEAGYQAEEAYEHEEYEESEDDDYEDDEYDEEEHEYEEHDEDDDEEYDDEDEEDEDDDDV